MAVGGTVGTPIWEKDGMYLSEEVETGTVTLGDVVCLTTAGKVSPGTAALALQVLGVAVGSNRFSRTATDNAVIVGNKVTVATRGVVNVMSDTSAITIGAFVEAANSAVVTLHTAGAAAYPKVLGMALEANGGVAKVIKVKLMRG